MNPMLKNILAIILGFIVGGFANFTATYLGMAIFPPPEGFDPSSMESFAATMHLLETPQYIYTFIAHSLNAFVGALVVVKMAADNQFKLSMLMGFLVFLAGLYNAFVLPVPTGFMIIDLLFAYIPMAWLGYKTAS